MNKQPEPIPAPSSPAQNVPSNLPEVEYLRQIAEHLKSIRAMVSFFTFIIMLAIILQIAGMFAPMMGP